MRILTSAKYAVSVSVAAALLAACSSGGGSQVAPGAMTGNAVTGGAHAMGQRAHNSHSLAMHPVTPGKAKQHFKQWMEPNANKNRLLYISDAGDGVVQVFNYPSNGTQNPPAGTLTGFEEPQGICTTPNGKNVFIVNTEGGDVLEYASGGTSPVATYSTPGEYPAGCSVDPTTGNLAISDIINTGSSGLPGAVTICSSPSSCSTTPGPGGLEECFFIGYMPNGDLYVDGFNGSFLYGLAYLPAGGSSWSSVSLSGATVNFPGAVTTDGTNLVLGDQSGSTGNSELYQCSAAGSSVSCSSSTNLGGSGDIVQAFIKRGIKGVVGGDAELIQANTWGYPAGGNPRPGKAITSFPGSFPQPIGAGVTLGD